MLFLSMMAVRLSSFNFPASIAASHTCPSWCSPSDMRQYTWRFLTCGEPACPELCRRAEPTCGEPACPELCRRAEPSILSPIAIPTACESPEPKGPDVVSSPGRSEEHTS